MIEDIRESIGQPWYKLIFPFQLNLLLSVSVAPTNRWTWLHTPQGGDRDASLFTSQLQLCLHNGPCSRVSMTIQQRHTVRAFQINKQAREHSPSPSVSCLPLPLCPLYVSLTKTLAVPWTNDALYAGWPHPLLTPAHPSRPGSVYF